MDIRKIDNSVYIKADNKNNNIRVERKDKNVEVNIDGDKKVSNGSTPIVIDAGGGNDRITVSNLPYGKNETPIVSIIDHEGDDTIFYDGNVKVTDKDGKNMFLEDKGYILTDKSKEAKINGFIHELDTLLKDKKTPFEKDVKQKVITIFEKMTKEKITPDVAKELDKQGKLKDLYKDMGSLVNQGKAGATASALLGILTLGTSFVAEAQSNYAYELYNVLKDAGTDPSILKKLRSADEELKK